MHRETTIPEADQTAGAEATGPHACGGAGGSCAADASPDRGGIWLRGNARPGIAIAIASVSMALLVALAVVLLFRTESAGPPLASTAEGRWLSPVVAGVLVAAGLVVAATAIGLTALPRLVLEGGRVRVRLAPLRSETVPIELVECFFLGSRLEPPRRGDARSGGNRVRTLVMRIAERAHDHAGRPTLPAWGEWREGSVTFDGRWCEPLSVDLARRLNRDLAAAKRSAGEPGARRIPGGRA
jgi:hypothetical protein